MFKMMKAKSILLVTVVCGLFRLSAATAQQRDSLEIDLNTALEIALSENPTVKVADMEITKKQYAKKSVFGTLLPEINLIGQYQRTIKKQTMYMDNGFGLGGDVDPDQFDEDEQKILGVLGKLMGPSDSDGNEGFRVGRRNQ
jgi:outer membrane protein